MIRARRASVAPLIVLAALGLAACGNGSSGHTATSASSPSASAAPAPQVSVAPGTFTGEAVTTFGADKVQAGYKEMADLTAKVSFQPDIIKNKTAYTAADFAIPDDQMTPALKRDWDTAVAKAIAGDAQAKKTINGVMYYGLEIQGYTLNPTGPKVVNQSISSPTVAVNRKVSGTQRLAVTMADHGEIRYIKDGKPVRVAFDKTITYNLVPAPAGGKYAWLIDSVTADFKANPTDIPDAS